MTSTPRLRLLECAVALTVAAASCVAGPALAQKKGGSLTVGLELDIPGFDPLKAQVGPDEYFVLGDNTVISKDARYWTDPIKLPAEDLDVGAGRVPGRFMLGKAFFVYWPAGHRPAPGLPGLVTNFGDMRFIH